MDMFSIRDLRERTGDLVRTAEAGHLSVVSKHGQPVLLAMPFDENLMLNGVNIALAVKLFEEGIVSVGRAAKVAGMDRESFMERLGSMGIPVVNYDAADLAGEMAATEEG